jgi:hypothetical protein
MNQLRLPAYGASDFDLFFEVVMHRANPMRRAPQAHALLTAIEVAGLVEAMFTFFYREPRAALSAGYSDLFLSVFQSRAACLAIDALAVTGFDVTREGVKFTAACFADGKHWITPP